MQGTFFSRIIGTDDTIFEIVLNIHTTALINLMFPLQRTDIRGENFILVSGHMILVIMLSHYNKLYVTSTLFQQKF